MERTQRRIFAEVYPSKENRIGSRKETHHIHRLHHTSIISLCFHVHARYAFNINPLDETRNPKTLTAKRKVKCCSQSQDGSS